MHDSLNRVSQVTNALGNTTTYTYRYDGQIETIVDAMGNQDTNEYDLVGNIIKKILPNKDTNIYTYDLLGRVTSETDALGFMTQYSYDAVGNITKKSYSDGTFESMSYDAGSNLITATDAIGATTSFAYDYVDRLINTTDALGNKTSMTYTKDNQVSSVTDANGNKTSYQYNLLGNVTKEISALGNEVNYTYDAVGNLSEIHQYKGVSAAIRSTMSDTKGYDATFEEVINTYAYNTNGQLIKEVNPFGSMVEYKYDATGNVISRTDEDGYTTTYLYDQVNNLVKETFGDGKETTYTYNPLNQVISMTDWLGTNTYDLDAIGRLKSVRDYKNRTTAYTWDGENNRTSITYPDRSTVYYTYDQKGQLITVTDANKGVTSYTYDKLGNVLSEKLANGDKTTYSYDALSRLNTITAKDSNGKLLYNNAFEYDAVGNKTSGIEEVSKNNNGNNNNSNNNSSYNRNENGYKSEYEMITYVYDALDQLIKVTNPDNIVEKYFYDTLGNRVQKEIIIPGKNENKESTTNVTKYTYNKDNQMLTLQGIEEEVALHQTSDLVNFEYDGRGNTVKISTQEGIIGQYRYDATNKMTHAINKKGIRSEYMYDGAGRRVKQKVEESNINVPEKSSLHDAAYFEVKFGTSSMEDIDYKKEMNYIVDITSIYNNVLKVYGENTKTQRYTYGLDVISMDTWHEKAQDNGNEKNNDKTLYYINNELGSVVTLVDGKDKVKVEYSYDTFGVVAEKNHVNDQSIRSNIFHYTGYQYDYQTGLYFANARYYIAEVGRFAEEDVYKGDGLNRYVYVRSNPLRYVDRSGYSSSEGTGNSGILLYSDKNNFGENSDTYKILVDLNKKWLAETYNNERNKIESLAVEVRRMFREGTPLLYYQDKIVNYLIENSGYMDTIKEYLDSLLIINPIEITTQKLKGFIELVKTGGYFDLKSQAEWQYPYTTYHGKPAIRTQTDFMYFEGMLWSSENLGNFNFGYIGAAFGYGEEFLCFGAGLYQIISGTSDWRWMYSYWDDPADNLFIRLGSRMYNNEYFSGK